MPTITIKEVDSTTAGASSTTTNAVYIPGYAITGPVNTPTLCESLSDFQSIFGTSPYVFKTNQAYPEGSDGPNFSYGGVNADVIVQNTKDDGTYTKLDSEDDLPTEGMSDGDTYVIGDVKYVWNGDTEAWDKSNIITYVNFYDAGDYEKSYIMAVELLNAGLPVMYERVFNADKIDDYTSYLNVYKYNKLYANATKLESVDDLPTEGMADGDNYAVGFTVYTWDADNESWTETVLDMEVALVLKAAYPGLVSKDIYATLEVGDVEMYNSDGQKSTHYYYTLTVGRNANDDLDTKEVEAVSTTFTFDKALAADYAAYTYFKDLQGVQDSSGLVTFNFDYDVVGINSTDGEVLFTELGDFVLTASADEDEFSVSDIYDYLSATEDDEGLPAGYYRFNDRGMYVLRFMTSGAYPLFEYDNNSTLINVLTIVANRGDVTFLVDYVNNPDRTLSATSKNSVYCNLKRLVSISRYSAQNEDIYKYAAMFMPYSVYDCTIAINNTCVLPASFGYLMAYATSIVNYPTYYAVAGATRGIIPTYISQTQTITNAIAESYQERDETSINAITYINPYGYIIWGNRTLKNNAKEGDLTASSFLNVRQLCSELKRLLFVTARGLTFEQNSDTLWINFKAALIPTLDQMISNNGISGYDLVRQKTDKKATLKALITIHAIEAVEDFDLTVELSDSETTVSE